MKIKKFRNLIMKVMALLLISILLFPSTVFASETVLATNFNDEGMTTIKTEYEMVLEESAKYKRSKKILDDKASIGEDPLEEYERALRIRASLSSAELVGMGYTEEEVELLKKFEDGRISFQEIAPRATATLTTDLEALSHTASRYSVRYNWSWSVPPTVLGKDGVSFGLYGIDSSSNAFDTKIDSKTSVVRYYYLDGRYHTSKSFPLETTARTVSGKFDTFIMDNTQSDRVWAKEGYITVAISPTVSGGSSFAAVRARAEYGHSTQGNTNVNISISVNPVAGEITIRFSVSSGTGSVSAMGQKQKVFYNNGNIHDET